MFERTGLSADEAAALDTCVIQLAATGRVDALVVGPDGRKRLEGYLICINHGLTYASGVLSECIELENLEGIAISASGAVLLSWKWLLAAIHPRLEV